MVFRQCTTNKSQKSLLKKNWWLKKNKTPGNVNWDAKNESTSNPDSIDAHPYFPYITSL